MVSKKLTDVADGTDPKEAVTKNIDLKNQFNILNN